MAKKRELTKEEQQIADKLLLEGSQYIYPTLLPKWKKAIETYLTSEWIENGAERLEDVVQIMSAYERGGIEAAAAAYSNEDRAVDLILLDVSKFGAELYRLRYQNINMQEESQLKLKESLMWVHEVIDNKGNPIIHPAKMDFWLAVVDNHSTNDSLSDICIAVAIMDYIAHGHWQQAVDIFEETGKSQTVLNIVLHFSEKGPEFYKENSPVKPLTSQMYESVRRIEQGNKRLGIGQTTQDSDEKEQ